MIDLRHRSCQYKSPRSVSLARTTSRSENGLASVEKIGNTSGSVTPNRVNRHRPGAVLSSTSERVKIVTTEEVKKYYRLTKNSGARPELRYALGTMDGSSTVVDCGCGAGSNIALLRSEGHTVHAFDIDGESIRICEERFGNDSRVLLSLASFGSFDYPQASLIVADASLFFCPKNEFGIFWEKTRNSLHPGGVFFGSFLGARDTMANVDFNRNAYWGDVFVFTENEVRSSLKDYEILLWKEYELDGLTPTGEPHHWHIFVVVAKLL